MSKIYKIPVTWEAYGVINVEAESLKEAIKKFDDKEDSDDPYSLPLDCSYIDDSFKREQDLETILLNNE